MIEEDMFEQWWSKHQDETWEAILTDKERAECKKRSPIWGSAFKKDAQLAWMARAELTPNASNERPASAGPLD